jgi:hypothetical protein
VFFKSICSDWCGRENEVVNLYAWGYLAEEVCDESILYDRTQIGIEVAVRQLRRRKFKKRVRTVRKDLVIWPKPRMTLWEVVHHNSSMVMEVHNEPLMIMEWKVNHYLNRSAHPQNRREHRGDIRWLCVTSRRPEVAKVDFVGYAVMVEHWRTSRLLNCVRVQNGVVDRRFLSLVEGDADEPPPA